MDNGQWTIENGELKVENLRMGNGKWEMGNDFLIDDFFSDIRQPIKPLHP